MRVSIAAGDSGRCRLLLLVSAPSADAAAAAPGAAAAPTRSAALYQMNEPAGATVMTDSSGNGNNGVINPAGVQPAQVFDGATGYVWSKRPPTEPPPAHPERVITVADDPASSRATRTSRWRSGTGPANPYGNIIQKGQARADRRPVEGTEARRSALVSVPRDPR